jgi:hypothetical protein
MRENQIISSLQALVEDPAQIEVLRNNPGRFSEMHDLDSPSESSLRKADLLFGRTGKSALAQNSTITFTTGSTITGAIDDEPTSDSQDPE